MEKNFVFLDEMLPGIRWDAKYATWDNFTGKPVDGYMVNRIVGTKELVLRCVRPRKQRRNWGMVCFCGTATVPNVQWTAF